MQGQIVAEKAWKLSESRNYDIFKLIVDIYKELAEWERLEDFCRKTYLNDPFETIVYGPLYYAYLKRNLNIKANEFYNWVGKNFPEKLLVLTDIKESFKKN
ncbi:MAG: hypothetical protein GF311_18155 [Candidatus Lokiarchaeota archaeon]|nr:hypothetical protein [Candidatus Lokiarchaeota archaeon]